MTPGLPLFFSPKLHEVVRDLRRSPLADRMVVFGSAARGKATAGDIDVAIIARDVTDLKWDESEVGIQARKVLRIARQHYGSLDPFLVLSAADVITGKRKRDLLLVRDAEANFYVRAKGARELLAAIERDSIPLSLLDTPGHRLLGNRRAPDGTFAAANFNRWFGDSKARHVDGMPATVFHGRTWEESPQDTLGTGLWFASSRTVASAYATVRGVFRSNEEPGPVAENVVPAYLHMRNPLEVECNYREYDNIMWDGVWWSTDCLFKHAKDNGHDGLILRNVNDMAGILDDEDDLAAHAIPDACDVYAVMHPSQIKSAIGNSGLFDPDSGSLTDTPDADSETEVEAPRERMRA